MSRRVIRGRSVVEAMQMLRLRTWGGVRSSMNFGHRARLCRHLTGVFCLDLTSFQVACACVDSGWMHVLIL